jgi:hypothetical protein
MNRSSGGLVAVSSLYLGLASALPVAAQDWRGNGRIEGLVLDAEERPVEGGPTLCARRR